MNKLNLFLKRAIDIVVSLIAIIILTVIPVFIVVPIIIKLTSKGPAFFNQVRVGRNGKTFTMYKFRTMIVETHDSDGNEIMPEDRITKLGKFLRKTSIDELPQLFNVLNGTMSIIGPRPMLEFQAPRCIGEEKLRFNMRPGLTGLAQVEGRNDIIWEDRIQHDIRYVKTYSLWLDIKIFFRTVLIVMKRKGTGVNIEHRGVSRFSEHYVPEEKAEVASVAGENKENG